MIDRQMCKLLADALDALTPIERRVLVKAALEDSDRPEWLSRLLDGLAIQAHFDEVSRQAATAAVLAPFEADYQRDLDEIEARLLGPFPQRTEGTEWWPEG
jgi:hypothetical protein